MKKHLTKLSLLIFVLAIGCKKGEKTQDKEPGPDPVVTEEPDGDPDIGDLTAAGIFYDKFEGTFDDTKWEKLNQIWGQPSNTAHQHGGVIKENVYLKNGFAVMRALGDQYSGTLRGAGGQSKRLGGVAKSKQRFASGRYEIKMRVLQTPDMGVLSAAWTFWYKQITAVSNPEAYQKAVTAGNIPDNGTITLNHEIDIEIKGVNLGSPLLTNWIGEKAGEYESKAIALAKELNDNSFHIYRWDWHTGGNGQTPRVEYYIDNKLLHTSTVKVPYLASYIYIGNWFAWWAGNDSGTYKAPDFDSKEMFVDWVKFTPFNEPNDDRSE
ncbi:glycosyl hydrolase family 16 [Arcticibacter tournemirensis]|uniref:Glycoside hydrolase family 16 protein n=1 Tax=Arcticibacter tournemirensis TaxID=699437 RepID=A0A5M9HHV3_9SPHI|nr:glycoside hydrolase family 16 protein [Arcticibacter tournemirensis]KAA8484958.1 glycoside hydrolase family 16 protein [Arcticibacter tournemirensis]TQM50601.1 glycosyl hydrolase family 16 [Arcticibacter tournemirensis]